MSAFVWEPWELPEEKDPTTELPDGFIRTRYVMGEDMNDIFSALTQLADAVRLGGGILAPRSGVPTEEDGTFTQGHVVWNTGAVPGGPAGWICTESGTPGTWSAFGRIDGAIPVAQEVESDGETISLAGETQAFIGLYPDGTEQVRGRIGFTGFNFTPDPEEDPPLPEDYDSILYIENSFEDDGHIVIDPGLSAEVHFGTYTHGNAGTLGVLGPTRFIVGGGNMVDATAERIRFPRRATVPTEGTYEVGDLVFNTGNPESHVGWVCIAAGTPGTWEEWGPVKPESTFNGGTISTELTNITAGYGFTQSSGGIEYSSYVGLGMAWMGTVTADPFAFYTDDNLAQFILEVNGSTSIGYTTAQAPTSKLLVNGVIESATGGFKLPDGTVIADAGDLGGGGGGGDHSGLTNLDADDHPQYALADGTRGSFAALLHEHGDEYAPAEHEHEEYLTEEQASTLYAPLGSGGGGVTDHGALTGLADNDHPQYSLTTHNHDADYSDIAHHHDADYAAFVHEHDSTYSPLAHTHTFASLTSKPTTLAGYGITDAAALTHDHDATYSALAHTHTFASLTSKPTTLAGYGITDAAALTHDHDADYSALGHDHDSDYAALTHDHDGNYAAIGHDHSGVYQPADTDLAAIAGATLTGDGVLTRTSGTWTIEAAGGGVSDHGALTGLSDDDHTQYALADGSRGAFAASGHHHDAAYAALSHHHDGAYSALGHNHSGVYQPVDADLTAIAALTGSGDGYLKRTSGAWAIDAGGVTDHGALTGLADDDHTQYLLANGSRVLAALSLSGAIDRSTAAALSIGATTATGVNIGRSGQPNVITGSQTTFSGPANAYPLRLTDGTRTLSFWVGTPAGLECEFGTESNHSLSIYTNNGTPQWLFGTAGDFVLRTTPSATGGGLRYGDSGQRVTYMAAAPASGTWVRGSVVFNTAPSASGFVGWVCTTAGTPGTWKTFGAISA